MQRRGGEEGDLKWPSLLKIELSTWEKFFSLIARKIVLDTTKTINKMNNHFLSH